MIESYSNPLKEKDLYNNEEAAGKYQRKQSTFGDRYHDTFVQK